MGRLLVRVLKVVKKILEAIGGAALTLRIEYTGKLYKKKGAI